MHLASLLYLWMSVVYSDTQQKLDLPLFLYCKMMSGSLQGGQAPREAERLEKLKAKGAKV